MSILGIVANPAKGSFSHSALRHALDGASRNGLSSTVVDLYGDRFDPVLTIEEIRSRFSFNDQVLGYQEQLSRCTGIVISYPDWWGMPPAILKGYLDRVLRPGVAFDYDGQEFGDKTLVPILHCPGLILTSADAQSPEEERAVRTVWSAICSSSGIDPWRLLSLGNIKNSSKNLRSEWLEEIAQAAEDLFTT